jgi:hypothetical protein
MDPGAVQAKAVRSFLRELPTHADPRCPPGAHPAFDVRHVQPPAVVDVLFEGEIVGEPAAEAKSQPPTGEAAQVPVDVLISTEAVELGATVEALKSVEGRTEPH